MRFAAVQDDTSKIITHLLIVVVLLIGVRQVLADRHDAIPTTIALIILLPALLIAWSVSPRYYVLTAADIIIKGHLRSIRIPLKEVLRLRSIEEEELGESARVFASGGVFGYLGAYRSAEMGDYQRWCTNNEHLVLIESANTKWVISPDNSTEFVKAVNRIINKVD
ncbi:PH domain-containing protein [Chitinophaga sp. CB10]|uniref:PH domain-containing protein n=1 Tax=Chitinophaga sp. CB10 TaxID=1891659 RepID=UPI0025C2A5F3|nr:PH domain-containing protein [Chitinophaga sp. CB10]